MKAATVADLRNNFAAVSRWIYEGESVTICKRGKAFAILAPAARPPKSVVVLPDYEARMQRIFGRRKLGGATAEEVVDFLRGDH